MTDAKTYKGMDTNFQGLPLTPERIAPHVRGDVQMYWKEHTGSTNDDAKKWAALGAQGPAVCVAEVQLSGKGRLGRGWNSQISQAIEMSLMLRPHVPAQVGAGLGLAAALGVSRAIEKVTGLQAGVKWPNDIIVNRRKICGILIESAVSSGLLDFIVIGIGVNVNQTSFPEELKHVATSVALETGQPMDRAPLAGAIIESVIGSVYDYFDRGYDGIRKEYERRSTVLGRTVDVTTNEGIVTGKCVGFGALGEILVSVVSGTNRYSANDVSVREARDV